MPLHQDENLAIQKMRLEQDVLVELKDLPCPTTLIRSYQGKISKEAIEKAKELTKYYSLKARDKKK